MLRLWHHGLLAVALVGPAPAAQPGPKPFDPVITSLTLFAGNTAGLWRSSDWGGSWEQVAHEGLEELGTVRDVVATGSTVYVAGDGGLYVSTDFGSNWLRYANLAGARSLLTSRYLVVDPTIFIGTASGLFRSRDGGWTFQPTPLKAVVGRMEWPGPALVVATDGGVRVSRDSGETFVSPEGGLPAGAVHSLAVSSFFVKDPVAFAGVGSAGVFRSSDGGRTWTTVGLAGRRVNDLVWMGPLLYAATDLGLFRSQDAGAHWTPMGEGLTGLELERLLFPLAPDSAAEAFVATRAGIYRTVDGGLRWRLSGLKAQHVQVLATFPAPSQAPVQR